MGIQDGTLREKSFWGDTTKHITQSEQVQKYSLVSHMSVT